MESPTSVIKKIFVNLRSQSANLNKILKIKNKIYRFFYFFFAVFSSLSAYSAEYVVTGEVIDSITGEPVPYVAIYRNRGTSDGVMTDVDGKFEIKMPKSVGEFTFMGLGFEKRTVSLHSELSPITVAIMPKNLTFEEVVVKPKREKYSKKNNPAVDFVNRIRNSKGENDPKNHDYYHYQKYEKFTLALNDFHINEEEKGLNKKFKFMKEYIDTSEISGKQILNVSIKEKVSDYYYQKSPQKEREIVNGIRRVGIDDIVDQEAVQVFVDDIVREIDIYQNDVTVLRNRFVSPLSRIGPDFYKYYLSDTVMVDSVKCIELSFTPHSPETFGFHGRLYVPLNDSTMFVKKIVMGVPKSINLNFVDKLYINQEYVKADDFTRLKVKDDLAMELSLIGQSGLFVRRNTTYDNHDFKKPVDNGFFGVNKHIVELDNAKSRDDKFWDENRKSAITRNEKRVEKLIYDLRHTPVYYYAEKALKYLVSGYVQTGKESKFDFGPLNTSLSGNAMEGFRMRVGGITTANLSPHFFLSGYAAYGFKDHKFKYRATVNYSFKPKRYHPEEFPIHGLSLTHSYEVDKIGQHYLFTNPDNMFLAIKWQSDRLMTYRRLTKGEYRIELDNGFSLRASAEMKRHESSEFIKFANGKGETFDHIDCSSFGIQLRFAPGEKFFQTKTERLPVNLDAPIFLLSHQFAPSGLFGNKFTLNRTEISAQKRVWFSAFGFADVIVKAGKVWGTVPYTELLIPNANLSYTIQPESFALMNPMEFVNDTYYSWYLTYFANGALLNHIPLIKKLKFREVFAFRGHWGKLSDKNNPLINTDQILFPESTNTQMMTKTPYMEASVGLENILKILRVEYVWRLSYRDNPGVKKSGVRLAVHITF